MRKIESITEFEQALKTNEPVLLDFYADWCGPCQSLLPVLDELSNEYKGQVSFIKIDVDQFQELAQQFQVRSIPALFYMKNGQVVERTQGLLTKSVLREKLDHLRAALAE